MVKSSLTDITVPASSSNYTKGRNGYKICKITPHHMAGVLTAAQCGKIFQNPNRNASSNYGIGNDGKIACYVGEENRAWTSSSPSNDYRAITIEVSNSSIGGDWKISDKAWNSLVNLCVDICKRYNFRLVYDGTPNGSLTRHNMFANTNCPGPYLQGRFPELVKVVNAKLDGKPVSGTVFTYQTFTGGKWLPNVKNDADYAGIFGKPVTALYVSKNRGSVKYKVHIIDGKKSRWLPAVIDRTDYAGIKGKPVDGLMVENAKYRVHLLGKGWLPWVTGYNEKDSNNGYAGILGKQIDGIQIKPL